MEAANPRKISFLDNICDSCGVADSSCKLSALDTSTSIPDTGWVICSNVECKKKYVDWQTAATITIDDLKKRYGNTINVKRSTGEVQTDWKFSGNAFRAPGDDECWWVRVSDSSLQVHKHVTTSMLDDWNQTPH